MKRLIHIILAALLAGGLVFGAAPVLAQGEGAPPSVLPTQPRQLDIFNPEGYSTQVNQPNMQPPVNLLEVGPSRIITFIFSSFTLVSIIVAIYAGALIIFSGGDQKKVENGVRALIYAALGMLIVGAAWLIVRVILNIDFTRIW